MKKKRKEILVSVVLFSLAVLILSLVAIFTVSEDGQVPVKPVYDLLSKFAFALLVAVVMRVTLVYLYGEDAEAFDKFRDLGMEELYHRLTDEDLKRRLGESDDIQVLKTWFPETQPIEEGLEKAITENKATVKLLLCKPTSHLLTKRSETALDTPSEASGRVYYAIRKVRNWCSRAPGAKVEVALYDAWPGCPVIWYHNATWHSRRIIMGFYFRKKPSTFWPWIRVRNESELAKTLDEQFKDLWCLRDTEKLTTVNEMDDWLKRNKAFDMFGDKINA